jgi:hypothetical protein
MWRQQQSTDQRFSKYAFTFSLTEFANSRSMPEWLVYRCKGRHRCRFVDFELFQLSEHCAAADLIFGSKGISVRQCGIAAI